MMKTAGVMRPLLYCLVLAFSVQPAGAGDGRAVFGVKFTPFRFYGWQSDQPLVLGSGSLDSYFGLRTWRGMYVLWGADFAQVSIHQESTVFEQHDEGTSRTRVLIPHIGVKVRLNDREEVEVHPYLYGNVFRSFGVIVEDDVSQGFQADLASPWGWTVAFGSESRLKDGLWLAGEVGFRYVSGRARQEQLNVSKEQSFSWGYLYTALTLQFRLF